MPAWPTTRSGTDGGSGPTVPAIEAVGVVAEGALVVAAAGRELVGLGGLGDAERVADHREDVGVLHEQRARAELVERVAEGPQPVAVAVGDGADRAEA